MEVLFRGSQTATLPSLPTPQTNRPSKLQQVAQTPLSVQASSVKTGWIESSDTIARWAKTSEGAVGCAETEAAGGNEIKRSGASNGADGKTKMATCSGR